MNVHLIIVLLSYLSFIPLAVPSSFDDVTSNTLGASAKGLIAAFGDYNANKNTDLFVIGDAGTSVKIYLATKEVTSDESKYQEVVLIPGNTANGTVITSVVPADFDGDNQMDILVTRQLKDVLGVRVQIYWGHHQQTKLEAMPLEIQGGLKDQPLVLDANGDMIPDLLGESLDGKRQFYIFQNGQRNYTTQLLNDTADPLRYPQSSAFLDLNGDLTADLCVVSEKDKKPQLEYWYNKDGVLTFEKSIPYPTDAELFGQITFLDIGANRAEGNHVYGILPACTDTKCTKSVLYVLTDSQDQWSKLDLNIKSDKMDWNFVPPDKTPAGMHKIPITVRVGDYNLDGYPDLLAVLRNTSQEGFQQKAFILENRACSKCATKRHFGLGYEVPMHSDKEKALLPAFYDFQDNGILDLIVTTYGEDNSPHIHLLKHTFTDDAFFLKVKVVSGLCSTNCLNGREPYGINQPGPVVKYTTEDNEGRLQIGIASQLTQSAHFSLQLPFTVFGLGQTPNFVDTLEVSIPYPTGKSARKKSWTAVIPNSQLIIIPYPNDDPSSWINKLFITPSRLVLLTGAALLGTCGFLAGIVGILHWREKIEDKKEKLIDSHKFHFDAM
ncbi:T-cell immunomodulatory protein-like isoform X4 [Mytilus galloprovincialis]|uniref:T-cell immunomodulatory protein-like isoform X1 n=1 Tax=Mytilus galloprovincialis TaxID=29158 RepID=UPI003F7C433E